MTQYVGLTGYMGSGKGEIARILKAKGYRYISLSDMVRQEATRRGLEHTRENLQDTGNDLRSTHGAGVLGMKVCEEIKKYGDVNWVIDGIRNPAEAEALRKIHGMLIVGVSAADDLLIDRMLSRSREGMSLSREDLIAKLKREKGEGESPDGQQVKKCLEKVDFFILNEGTLEDLEKKFDHFLKLYKGEQRLSFDEIFMEISYTWAKRSTCLRRHVGSVIAKDGQQLTAGYNGAPRGVPHCAELGGCLREKLGIPSGQRHEICRGTHAEQNAITQAAKFGINIEGGTLYCNCFPCIICAKMILNSGIEKVVYDSDYDDPVSKEMLAQQTNLKIVRYEGKKFGI
ncbi:AAA family ATPase [Candidatus Peregrinibacteria bacterium]|jgi:dCMP deaminase|nr:AAA family ATPase [Candidatus Peregrinibacteria bacterium]